LKGAFNIENEKLTGVYFKIKPEHLGLIKQKMKAAGIINMSAYIRKMCCDGYIVRLDLTDVRKMVSLLQNSTNNLNQIARRVNGTGSIFENDIADIRANYELLWNQAEAILRGLSKIQR